MMSAVKVNTTSWAEHLTSLPTRTVGALSSVSAFNHERVPMSCFQQLDAPEANN